MEIYSLTYFRAIAILIIAVSHCYHQVGFAGGLAASLTINLIAGGTAFFVFISGLLFHHVFAREFDYRRFMAGKLRNVTLPYLVMAVPIATLIPMFSIGNHATFFDQFLVTPFSGAVLRLMIERLATGTMLDGYWYVPFAMVLFAMSPLHMAFIRRPAPQQLAIIAATYALALLVHRPELHLNVLHHVVYFTPVYLIGIMVSVHRDKVWPLLRGRELPLFLLAVSIALIALAQGHVGNYHRFWSLGYVGIDLMLLQKTALTFAILALLIRFDSVKIPCLTSIADCSFGIFFLHPVLIRILQEVGAVPDTGNMWVDWALLASVAISLSYAITRTIQITLGRRSRWVIGS